MHRITGIDQVNVAHTIHADTDNSSRTTAWIDLSALRHNGRCARQLSGNAKLCAVVKANAYGHGIEAVVPTLMPLVDSFAVATVQEGIEIRRIAREHPIMVLSEFNHPSQVTTFNTYQLQPIIHQPSQLSWLRAHGGVTAGCWLKVDTGMHRLGFAAEKVGEAYHALTNYCGRAPGLMSHFATADESDHPLTTEQFRRFCSVSQQFDTICSIANSAALLHQPHSRLDLVRAGLMLYGISPMDRQLDHSTTLDPVMRFTSTIIAIKHLSPGCHVGYGATWCSQTPCTMAIVGVGYADGYPRIIGNRGHTLVAGKVTPVIGRVSMDTLALDVTACGKVAVGDEVELWGDQLNVRTVAAWADTIPYELLCRVSPRVPRAHIENHPGVS